MIEGILISWAMLLGGCVIITVMINFINTLIDYIGDLW